MHGYGQRRKGGGDSLDSSQKRSRKSKAAVKRLKRNGRKIARRGKED